MQDPQVKSTQLCTFNNTLYPNTAPCSTTTTIIAACPPSFTLTRAPPTAYTRSTSHSTHIHNGVEDSSAAALRSRSPPARAGANCARDRSYRHMEQQGELNANRRCAQSTFSPRQRNGRLIENIRASTTQ